MPFNLPHGIFLPFINALKMCQRVFPSNYITMQQSLMLVIVPVPINAFTSFVTGLL